MNRINSFYLTFLGLLSGMSVIHLIFIGLESDEKEFLKLYARYAFVLNLIFLILANFCLIFGITMALIFGD